MKRKGERGFVGRTEDCAVVDMVSWVVTADPEGVKVVGLNEHVAPVGKPRQAKLRVELNPYCGVTVSVTVPSLPDFRVREAGATWRTKLGGGAIVTASGIVPVTVVPPLVPVMESE